MRALLEHIQPPNRRDTQLALGIGLLVALLCWYFGVDVWHSLLLGCAIPVIALAILVISEAADARDLRWRGVRRSNRDGSRNDVANLAGSLRGGWGFVGATADRQLRQIARRRLSLEGLDLSNPQHRPAIEQRIGARAYRVLSSPVSRMPRLHTLQQCLDMLDAIDSTHYPVPAQRSRRWGPLQIPSSLGRPRDR